MQYCCAVVLLLCTSIGVVQYACLRLSPGKSYVPCTTGTQVSYLRACILSGRNLMSPRGLPADAQLGVETERGVALCFAVIIQEPE